MQMLNWRQFCHLPREGGDENDSLLLHSVKNCNQIIDFLAEVDSESFLSSHPWQN